MDNEKNIQRWRLILGNDSQERLTRLNGGASILSSEMDLLDQALLGSVIHAKESAAVKKLAILIFADTQNLYAKLVGSFTR